MRGLMQETPLVVNNILDYAAKFHASQEVVSRMTEGNIVTVTYRELHARAQQCALALKRLGVREGERVATMAWNTMRHLESWYGIMGIGAVCHTLNPRLFLSDLEYIINHAEDCVILYDITFIDLINELRPKLPTVRAFVVMTDRGHMPSGPEPCLCYEELLAAQLPNLPFRWEVTDENTACGLCYTSGTTGRPKGVLYSHRSNFLHSMLTVMPDGANIGSTSTVLAVVPMFHANSWGLAFGGPLTGAKLIMPGPRLDGESVYRLMEDFQVTTSSGVPTIWLGLLNYMDASNSRFSTLKMVTTGGAACPRSIIEKFQDKYGVEVRQCWGMTELSPTGTIAGPKAATCHLTGEQKLALQLKAGRGCPLVDMRVVAENGAEQPWDGKSFGNLQVRGPWVVRRYYKHDGDQGVNAEGWFDTGDVAHIDPEGYMQITDRSKDVIKSGGEWISSIEIESAAQSHPKVLEAAVIGIPHEKWTERPLLVVVAQPGESPTPDELRNFLKGKIANWWIPDDVILVKEIPHTAVGKIAKVVLRQQLKDYSPAASKL